MSTGRDPFLHERTGSEAGAAPRRQISVSRRETRREGLNALPGAVLRARLYARPLQLTLHPPFF